MDLYKSVMEQVFNLNKTSIVQNSWKQRRARRIHGWVYQLNTDLIKDSGVLYNSSGKMPSIFRIKSKIASPEKALAEY